MSYEIMTYLCNHKEEVWLEKWQKNSIDDTIEYYKTRLCFDCYKHGKYNEIESLNLKNGFKKITGSTSSVEKLRSEITDTLNAWIASNDKQKQVIAKQIFEEDRFVVLDKLNKFTSKKDRHNLYDAYINIALTIKESREELLRIAFENDKKRSLIELNKENDKFPEVEIYRDFIYSKIDTLIDSDDNKIRIAATVLLEEKSIDVWYKLKIKCKYNEIKIIEEYTRILDNNKEINESISKFIDKNEDKVNDKNYYSAIAEYDEGLRAIQLISRQHVMTSKNDKYLVLLNQYNEAPIESWLSKKQFNHLEICFKKIEYSNCNNYVFAIIRDTYFVWAGIVTGDVDDRDYISSRFRVKIGIFKNKFTKPRNPTLKIPKNIEIIKELIDEDDIV